MGKATNFKFGWNIHRIQVFRAKAH